MLVKKKNVYNSVDISDQYHLCTDYQALNASLQNSGWPTPIDECLDPTHDLIIFHQLTLILVITKYHAQRVHNQLLSFPQGMVLNIGL